MYAELVDGTAAFSIYVDKNFGSKGYGRKLWTKFEDWAREKHAKQIFGFYTPYEGREKETRKFYERNGVTITKNEQGVPIVVKNLDYTSQKTSESAL